jgi:hypothetical protein
MKRKLFLAALALALVAACGVGAGSSPNAGPAPGAKSGSAPSSGRSTANPGQAVAQDQVTAQGPRVIQTASISLEVRSFDAALDSVIAISDDLGGHMSGSAGRTDTGSLRAGTVSFAVPAPRFNEAVNRVRRLGKVQQLDMSGQDVSAQYVDLQARLKGAQAEEAAYRALLQRATSIQDILTIENQLGQVMQRIEQLEGQIDYLDHASSYSTISVAMHEAAVAPAPVDSWGFQTALVDSLHGFVNTLDWIIVGLGSALPVLVILGLIGFGTWRWTRRPRVARSA